MYQVVVVGGGPVGRLAAHLVAGEGLQCAVVDDHPCPDHAVTCTGIVGTNTFRQFALPPTSILGELHAARIFSPSGFTFTVSSSRTMAYLLSREILARDLYRSALEQGVHFYFDFHCLAVKVKNDRVIVVGRSEAGQREALEAQVAIIATGVHSHLTQMLGLGRPSSMLDAAQVEAEMEGLEAGTVEIYLGRGWGAASFAWVVPVPGGRSRIGITTPAVAARHLKGFLASSPIAGRLQRICGEMRSRPIPWEPLSQTYGNRILVAGDAAGQVKPITGGGLYFGFIGAAAAAQTVAEAFRKGDFGAPSLSRYEQRWKSRIGLEISTGAFFRRLASRLTDEDLDALVKACRDDGLARIFLRAQDFDLHSKVVFALLHSPWGHLFRKSFPDK